MMQLHVRKVRYSRQIHRTTCYPQKYFPITCRGDTDDTELAYHPLVLHHCKGEAVFDNRISKWDASSVACTGKLMDLQTAQLI